MPGHRAQPSHRNSLAVALDDEIFEAVEELASKTGSTIAHVIRELVKNRLIQKGHLDC